MVAHPSHSDCREHCHDRMVFSYLPHRRDHIDLLGTSDRASSVGWEVAGFRAAPCGNIAPVGSALNIYVNAGSAAPERSSGQTRARGPPDISQCGPLLPSSTRSEPIA